MNFHQISINKTAKKTLFWHPVRATAMRNFTHFTFLSICNFDTFFSLRNWNATRLCVPLPSAEFAAQVNDSVFLLFWIQLKNSLTFQSDWYVQFIHWFAQYRWCPTEHLSLRSLDANTRKFVKMILSTHRLDAHRTQFSKRCLCTGKCVNVLKMNWRIRLFGELGGRSTITMTLIVLD